MALELGSKFGAADTSSENSPAAGQFFGSYCSCWAQEHQGGEFRAQPDCSRPTNGSRYFHLLFIFLTPAVTQSQGIISCFKAHYRAKYIGRAVARYDQGITPSEIYNIDQLHAMRLANAAWWKVDTTMIRNCWHKSGILPLSPDTDVDPATVASLPSPSLPISALIHNTAHPEDTISDPELELNNALDTLVQTGALQAQNRMDIETLLNPEQEKVLVEEISDEELFRTVMEAREMQEMSGITGSDDIDDSSPVKPQPTHVEALRAISLITDYIDSVNDPIARKLEAVLGSFSRQICLEQSKAMKETLITDYFHHSSTQTH